MKLTTKRHELYKTLSLMNRAHVDFKKVAVYCREGSLTLQSDCKGVELTVVVPSEVSDTEAMDTHQISLGDAVKAVKCGQKDDSDAAIVTGDRCDGIMIDDTFIKSNECYNGRRTSDDIFSTISNSAPDGVFNPVSVNRGLKYLKHFMSTDATRRHINCVALSCKNGMQRMIATDGHTLATTPLKGFSQEPQGEGLEVTVPAHAVPALERLSKKCGSIRYHQYGGTAVFVTHVKSSTWVLQVDTSKDFPPVDQCIPKGVGETVLDERADHLAALFEMAWGVGTGAELLVDKTRSGSVSLQCSESLVKASFTYPATDPIQDRPFRMGVNPAYMVRALTKDFDLIEAPRVAIHFTGKMDPVRVEHADGSIAVVMPMRMQEA